jgi:Tfp pilus assembly protein PilP
MKLKLLISALLLGGCVVLAQTAAPADPMKAKPAAKKTQKAKAAKPAAAQPAPEVARSKNKRDPFVSPVVTARAAASGPACAGGKRCLMIGSVVIKGIVRGPNGMIAVVATPDKRGYFLRENDPVFNGYVYKITGDSVVFRENTLDNLGRSTQREVVKRIVGATGPAV